MLVTGAAGFIGSALTKELLAHGKNVVAIDCFLPDLYSAETKKLRWKTLSEISSDRLVLLNLDLRFDKLDLLREYDIGVVFNQAAMPGLIQDWGKAKIYYECNLHALNRLLEHFRYVNEPLESFVQASTSSVYGKLALGDESTPAAPTSPYGVSKLAAENLLLAYQEWFAIPVTILRYFSVYGPGQRPDMAYATIIDSILKNEVFTIHGDGEQRRSNTYIKDVIDATILAGSVSAPGAIINICGDQTYSLNEVIAKLEIISGQILKLAHIPSRIGDQRQTSGINVLAKRILGWNATTNLLDGLTMQFQEAASDFSRS